MNTVEKQLWLWLDACEEGKPRQVLTLEGGDKVVPFLQYGVREGREASEEARSAFFSGFED